MGKKKEEREILYTKYKILKRNIEKTNLFDSGNSTKNRKRSKFEINQENVS